MIFHQDNKPQMIKIAGPLFSFFFFAFPAFSQDDSLLKLLESDKNQKEYVTGAFKSSRVINSHSMEFLGKGVLDLRILHRFGKIDQGVNELFGLDQASMRIGLDYGVGNNLTVGVGRTTLGKDIDGFVKWRAVRQVEKGFPFSWVLIAGMSVYTFKNTDPQNKLSFSSRAGYYYQSIFGRKFNQTFSLQLSPTLVHRNQAGLSNNIYALGVGSRLRISKRTALMVDYFPVINRSNNEPDLYNALSFGVDIETGGHVFQLHFSNATGMNERAFIANTQDKWSIESVRFGFNISRVFTLKRPRVLK
jgi:hypothetical protein